MCFIKVMVLSDFSDPVTWEAYRVATPREQALAEVLHATDPVIIARRVELLILAGGAHFDEAARLLPLADSRLREGLRAHLLARRECWHEALNVALAYTQPRGTDPLILEGALIVYTNGGMSARQFRLTDEANRLIGRALSLVDALGLEGRWVQVNGELERGLMLEGKGDADRIRRVRARSLIPRQWEHNTHNVAEELCGRGQYAQALAELQDAADDRSVGMRAFCAAMLGQGIDDPGGADDWLRLARAVRAYGAGASDVADLSMFHEPQVSYARTLTAAAVARGVFPERALGLPAPKLADQRVFRVLILLRLLSRGVAVGVAGSLPGEWRAAMREIYDRAAVFRVVQDQAGTALMILALMPDAPPELRAWLHDRLILCGGVFRQGEREWPASGRAGAVLIAEGAGVPAEPLRGAEPSRFAPVARRALRESGEVAWLNPGEALRAAWALVQACPDDVHVRQLPHAICGIMTQDARDACMPYAPEVS